MTEKTAVHTPTKEEYDRLMKAYEKKEWRWISGNKPTEFNDRHRYGEETAVDMHDNFGKQSRKYQKRDGYTIITVDEAIAKLGLYERGQEVLVSYNLSSREKRIYIGSIDGAMFPYITVSGGREDAYKAGKPYHVALAEFIKPLEPSTLELTMKDIEDKFGCEVKIVESK